MSTTTEPIITEQTATPVPQAVEAPPVPQAVEAPPAPTTTTEEEQIKTEEPTVDEVTETSIPEATPTASKSNPTNRLSLFLGKAKTFVDKKVHEKKPPVPKKETEEVVETTTEPTPIASPVTEEPTTTSEDPVTRDIETKVPKSEKRKSILAGIFRSKSPVNKEVEKSEDVTPATEEVAKPDETVTEIQETPAAVAAASATGVIEEDSIITEHHEKENVMDQIKRGPLGKFFNKKKEPEHTTTETEIAPVTTDPVVVTEETPAVAAAVDVVEPIVETTSAPAQPEEKAARSGSPLGRRITQMFRGFSSKKKVPTVATEEPKEEGTREIVADTTVDEDAPAAIAAPVEVKEEEQQHEKPADVVVPPHVPAIQPTA